MKIALALEHFDPMHGVRSDMPVRLAAWLVERGCTIEIFAAGMRRNRPLALRSTVWRTAGAGVSHPNSFARGAGGGPRGQEFDVVHGFNHVRRQTS